MSLELPFFQLPMQLKGRSIYTICRDDNRELRRGYMSVVYKARSEQNELMALKTLWRLNNPSAEEQKEWAKAAAQFANEITTLQKLKDIPGIVQVKDRGSYDGVPWYVMEYLDGQDIVSGLSNKTRREQVRTFGEAVKTLGEAHKKGIAHLGLKPSNILLRRNQEPVLLDFGVSRVVHLGWQKVSVTSGIAAKPHYMAPEQFVSSPDSADWQQTDIWALGVLFYEILLGRHPFHIEADDEGDDIADKILLEPLPDFAHELRDQLLGHVLTRAMAREREKRYANVWELLADLSQWEKGQFNHCLSACRASQAQGNYTLAREQALAAHVWSPYEPQVKECLVHTLAAQYQASLSLEWHRQPPAETLLFWQATRHAALPPGIARIYEVNTSEPCFIAVEAQRGIPLQQFLHQRGEREDADILDYSEALMLWQLLRTTAEYATKERLTLTGFDAQSVYCEFDKKHWHIGGFSLWGIGWRGRTVSDPVASARDTLLAFLHSATMSLPARLECLVSEKRQAEIENILRHWGAEE
jgi:predicted Ser/Thr protein kinase